MTRRWYKTCVNDEHTPYPLLVVEVYSTVYEKDYMIFRVPLTRLGFYENYLNRDRFFMYRPDTQEHLVVNDIYGDLVGWFTERLEWISANVTRPWSFELKMSSALDGQIIWSFQDRTDAILFKLSTISPASGLAGFDGA